MQLTNWEPLKEIDRFFDGRNGFYFPFIRFDKDIDVDMFEENGIIVANMILPDIDPKEVDINLENNKLTVSGRRNEEKEVDKKDYYSKEIRRGLFSRMISVPKEVDSSKTHASYSKGVLTVTMPVIAGAHDKSVKIEINK